MVQTLKQRRAGHTITGITVNSLFYVWKDPDGPAEDDGPITGSEMIANLDLATNAAVALKADAAAMATALAGKADTGHTHTIADVSGLQAAIDAKADGAATATALANKSDVGHGHAISEITNLQTALDGKQPLDAVLTNTTASFTVALLNKLNSLDDEHFKGLYADLGALQAAHPLAAPGDYATVDAGAASDVIWYVWDDSDDAWVASTASGTETPATVLSKLLSNPDTNVLTDVEKARIAGVQDGATANQTDAFLLARENHTGAQTIPTVTGLQTALDSKAAATHTHAISDVTGLQAALDAKAALSHTHTIANVTGLQTALDGKAATGHSHVIAEVTGLQSALNAKADAATTQTALDGKQPLAPVLTNTTASFTVALLNKLNGLDDEHFKGLYVNLSALNTAHPTAAPGDYAIVDAGAASAPQWYAWDDSDSEWAETGGGGAETPASVLSKLLQNADTNVVTDAQKQALDDGDTIAALLEARPALASWPSSYKLFAVDNSQGVAADKERPLPQGVVDAYVDARADARIAASPPGGVTSVAGLTGSVSAVALSTALGVPSQQAVDDAAAIAVAAADLLAVDSGTYAQPELFGAKGDLQSWDSSGDVTGTNTLTDTTNAPFTSEDDGKPIIIEQVGASGQLNAHIATLTYVSASQVTFSPSSVSNATGVTYHFATDDAAAIQAAVDTGLPVKFALKRYLVQSKITSTTPGQRFYGPSGTPLGLARSGAVIFWTHDDDCFLMQRSTSSWVWLSFESVRFANRAAIKVERTGNTDDADTFVAACHFTNCYHSLHHIGRGPNFNGNWVEQGDVAVYSGWPSSGVVVTNENHDLPYGWRAGTMRGNRFHSVDAALETYGPSRGQSRGWVIDANQIDVGNTLVRGGMIFSNITSNFVENAASIIVSIDAGGHGLVFAGNTFKGKDGGADPAAETPVNHIRFNTGATVFGVTMTGNSLFYADGNCVEVNDNIEDWSVCGNNMQSPGSTAFCFYVDGTIGACTFSANAFDKDGSSGGYITSNGNAIARSSFVANTRDTDAVDLVTNYTEAGLDNVLVDHAGVSAGTLNPSRRLNIKGSEGILARFERTTASSPSNEFVNTLGSLTFYVFPQGAQTGAVCAGADGLVDLGLSTLQWRDLLLSREVKIDGVKVLGAQGAAVADASGGATVDTEARAAINTLLARLRTHGLIAS